MCYCLVLYEIIIGIRETIKLWLSVTFFALSVNMTFSLIFSFKIISSHHKYFKNCVRIIKIILRHRMCRFVCFFRVRNERRGMSCDFETKVKLILSGVRCVHPHPLLRLSVSAIKTWIFFSILLQVFSYCGEVFLLSNDCVKVANFPLRAFECVGGAWVSQEVFSPKMCVSEELSILFLLNMSCVCVDVFVDSFSWCNIFADACVETQFSMMMTASGVMMNTYISSVDWCCSLRN